MKRQPPTTVPYSEWGWWPRVLEKVYRWTHHGQIRTLVISHPRESNYYNTHDL